MDGKLKGISLAVIGASMWGIMGIFVRNLSAAGFTSYDISFVRCLLAGVAFFLFKAIREPEILRIDAKGLAICFIYGIIAYGISFVSYGISVERIPVAVATVLMFMSPIWVAVLSVFVFKEKLQVKTAITILICIIGAALVADLLGASGQMDGVGITAGMINGFGVALQLMIPQYFAKKYKRDTMLVYGFLGAALMLSLFTNFSVIGNELVAPGSGKLIFNIFGIGILCTMVANVSFVKSTLYINSTLSSILSALEVVVGAVTGYVIFQEKLSVLQMSGAVIVVFGSLGPTILDSIIVKQQRYNQVSE